MYNNQKLDWFTHEITQVIGQLKDIRDLYFVETPLVVVRQKPKFPYTISTETVGTTRKWTDENARRLFETLTKRLEELVKNQSEYENSHKKVSQK